MKKSLVLAGLLLAVGIALEKPSISASSLEVPVNSHCVAWKTHKTLALVKRATAVGKSCQVTVTAIKKGDKLGAEVSVPIASFDSQEKKRDQEVLKILDAAKQPNIIFKTEMFTEADWMRRVRDGSGSVKGTLYIGKRPYPMRTLIKVSQAGGDQVVSGKIVTQFTALGIVPPVIGPGGSIAKVDDYVELHFSFNAKQLQNKSVIPDSLIR